MATPSAYDHQDDPASYIRFLDGARKLESVQQQKRLTFDLLDLHAGEKVLDVACGTGDDVRTIAGYVGQTGLSLGVDKSEAMIAEAQKRAAGMALPVKFRLGDVYHLDFVDNTFDGTRAERLFEHLYHPHQALAEMIRVTRPGGRIVVASPDMDSNLIDHPDFTVTRKIIHFECDRRPNGRAGQQLYGLFWNAGLTAIKVLTVTHIVTDYAEAVRALEMKERVLRAQEAGVISTDEGATWLEHLAQAGKAGLFFMSTTHFIVGGRKS